MLVVFVLFSSNIFAADTLFVSVKDGNWSDPTVWKKVIQADGVTVNASTSSTTVTINGGDATSLFEIGDALLLDNDDAKKKVPWVYCQHN